jgi:hypothetical protein
MNSIMPSSEMVPVFAATKLKLHPEEFTLVSLPLSDKEKALELFKGVDPFSTISVDHSEVSLILREPEWSEMSSQFEVYVSEGPYRAITFDIVLDLNLIGFLSVVSAVLVDEGISIYAVSTFLRDHILVKSSQADKAMNALGSLIQRCVDLQ